MDKTSQIIIIGGGLGGMTAALACAHKGLSVTLLDAAPPADHIEADFDGRASAISASSFTMFRHLGIAARLDGHVQPITDILISDGQAGYAPSPLTLHFDSQDAGDAPMGYMTENRRLRRALLDAVQDSELIDVRAPVTVETFDVSGRAAQIHLQSGETLSADILVAADGRNSFCRQQAGISVQGFAYRQKAIVTTVAHELPHKGVAHELFLPHGPFAILPITENRSSIVWTDSPAAVDAAMMLSDEAFEAELARRFGDVYGEVKVCAPRWAYPLGFQMADDYVKDRLALLGDAAHVIHPIAGQGLNMGLRDAAALADALHGAVSAGLDPASGLEDYAVWRNFDNRLLAASTDFFNRVFSNNIGPIKHLRRLGLGLMDRLTPAQAFFIKEAAGKNGELPSLLR